MTLTQYQPRNAVMRYLRLLLNLLILVVPLVILSVGAYRLVQRDLDFLGGNAQVAALASAEATKALGREVRIGRIKLHLNLLVPTAPNSVEVDNVWMAAGPKSNSGTLGSADKVILTFNLRQILSSDRAVPIISGMELVRPSGTLARNAKGRWNIEDLIKPSKGPARPFVDRIVFLDGTVYFHDEAFPHPPGVPRQSFVLQVGHTTGVVQIRPDKSVAFDATGAGQLSRIGTFHATGMFNMKPLRLDVRVDARRVNLPYFTAHLLPPARARLVSGQADILGSAAYLPPPGEARRKLDIRQMELHGTAQLANFAMRIPALGIPLEGIQGSLVFTTDTVSGNLRGLVGGTDTLINGAVFGLSRWLIPKSSGASLPEPTFALQGSLPNADIARFVQLLDVNRRFPNLAANARSQLRRASGRGSAQFQVSGPLDNLTATLAANFNALQSGRYQLGNVALRALYANHTAYAGLRARYAQGDLAVRAQVATRRPNAYRVEAHGRNVQLDALGLALQRPMRGVGNLDLLAQGERGSLPRLSGQAQVRNIKLNNQTLDSAYAQVDTADDLLLIRTLRLDDPKGFALARGTVNLKNRRLNLRVAADDLNLRALTGLLQKVAPGKPGAKQPIQVAGVGYVRGQLTGTFGNPLFKGRFTGFGLQAAKADMDIAEADVDFSKNALIISQATVRRYPGQVRLSGVIAEPLRPNAAINLTASADDLDLSEMLRLAGVDTKKVDLTGTLSADVRVTGTLTAPRIAANDVSLENAVYHNLPLDNATATVEYGPNGLQIPEVSVQVAGGTVRASGRMSKDKRLALDFSATGLQLNTLEAALGAAGVPQVTGTLAVNGTAQGTLQNPTVSVTADTQNLALNTVSLGELHAALTYADKQVRSHDISLGNAQNPAATGGSITVSRLVYDTQSDDLEAAISLNEIASQKLRTLVAGSVDPNTDTGKAVLNALSRIPASVNGVLSGGVTASGTLKEAIVDVAWNAHGLAENASTVFTGSARLTKTEAIIPSPHTPRQIAHIESGETYIDIPNVRIEYKGNIAGELNAYNLDLAGLQRWVRPDLANPVGGTGDLFIVASGETKSPVLDVSINLRDLTYAGQKLDRLDVAHATIREGQITADNITLTKRETVNGQTIAYTGTARGSVGFSWKQPGIPEDAPLDFEADINKQPLQLLSAFAPGLLRDSTGTISATARATGTLADPRLTGSVSLVAPKVRVDGVATGLRDVDAVFAFRGDRIVAERFTARSQVYEPRTGIPDPKLTGEPITLTGSLPITAQQAQTSGAEMHLTTSRIAFAESPLPGLTSGGARGTADLDIHIAGSVLEPSISGVIAVPEAQASLPRDFGNVQGGKFALPINPRFDLRVQIGQNVRLVNPQLNARASGNVVLTGELSSPHIAGTLTIHEGRLVLPTARFTILPPGTLRLNYPSYPVGGFGQPALAIDVDIRAQTYLTAASMSGVRRRYRVIVAARGPITGDVVDPITGQPRLALNFTTDPPDLAATQQELAQRIAGSLGGDIFTQLGRNPEQAIAAQLANVFTQSVLPGLFEPLAGRLGFEEFAFNYDPVQRLSFTVTRHLFGPLYATYIRFLNPVEESYDLKFSLRFQDRYQLSYTFNDQNTQEVLLEGIWHY